MAKQQLITEGNARFHAFLIGEGNEGQKWDEKGVPTKSMPVFYNPHMVLNRDLSVLAVGHWAGINGSNLVIGDIFCGGGIRGIRYMLDIPGNRFHVDFTDINPGAIKACQQNLLANNIPEESYHLHRTGANNFLHERALDKGTRFNVLDVDPFGNPMEYMTSALKALNKKSGLLHVNATDLAVITGVHLKAARRKYYAFPLRNISYHAEQSIRLLLGAIARKSMELDIHIHPLITVAKRHYVKAIIQTQFGATKANRNLDDIGYILHCFNCSHREIYRLDEMPAMMERTHCTHCKSKNVKMGGPMWIGQIQDREFCRGMLDNMEKLVNFRITRELINIIRLCSQEIDVVTSHDIHAICKQLQRGPPTLEKIMEKLAGEGYVASRSQSNLYAIKTDASRDTIIKITSEIKQ
ncbi:MAG: hypothetical protein ACTSUE_19465 [Promethearchaeota archaeon]